MSELRVLIVEDEFLVSDLIVDAVESCGHCVAAAVDAVGPALQALEAGPVDVAILDIRLRGDGDGVELARELRARFPATRHLFISGSGDPGTRARALATDPLAFLQKPFSMRELDAALSQARRDQPAADADD